ARRYRAAGSVLFEVTDPLDLTGGRYLLTVDEAGTGSVQQLTADAPADATTVRLGVSELSALLHGGARWGTLAAAGRISADADSTAWLDVAFAPAAPLQLSVGY
ncbi:MAG: sterol carrier protein domain-containing protein, partial [Dermabacteraceae bacterium]